jgi:hypothetical protein
MHHCLRITEIFANIGEYICHSPRPRPQTHQQQPKRRPAALAISNNTHRCLRLPEILTNICQYIYHSPDPLLTRNGDILSFALVCTNFLEPSLDVLWESHGSFARLIKTFPVDAWHETGVPPTLVSRDWLFVDSDDNGANDFEYASRLPAC